MKRLAIFIGLAMLSGAAIAQDNDAQQQRAAAKAKATAMYNEAAQAAGEEVMKRPGVLADREAKTVTLFGWSTDVGEDEPVEFFVIHEESGKDYEALSVATAKPSDVRAAIEFIGMKPGEPTNYPQLRFWPKGERMTMTIESAGDGKGFKARATEMVLDEETGKPLPSTGLVFTGSFYYEDDEGERKFAGDTLDTRGIAAAYNDAESLLVVPWRARQGDVYGQYRPNTDKQLKPFTPVTITLQPMEPNKTRVAELTLSIMPGTNEQLAFTLSDADGKAIVADATLTEFSKAVTQLIDAGRDPFVTVLFSDQLPVSHVMQAAALLESIDTFTGIRVEPPAEGHLFFRAFTPDPRWRDREQRIFHGWEVHLGGPVDQKPSLVLYDVTEGRDAEGLIEIREVKQEPADAAALAKIIEDADGNRPRDVYVFVDGKRPYGHLRTALAALIDTHKILFVYTK